MRKYEIFGSQTLLPYLVDHLQSPTCTLSKEGDSFCLGSFCIDALLATGSIGTGAQGIHAVLNLIDTSFATRLDEVGVCLAGIISILNGLILTKYNYYGVRRTLLPASETGGVGNIIDKVSGKQTVTSARSLPIRTVVESDPSEFKNVDKQPPTGIKIWEIAVNDAPIVRTLHYLSLSIYSPKIGLYHEKSSRKLEMLM